MYENYYIMEHAGTGHSACSFLKIEAHHNQVTQTPRMHLTWHNGMYPAHTPLY